MAVTTRAWNADGRVAPTGRTSLFSMARSSLAWVDRGSSPISSRKTVPRPGGDEQPGVVAVGPGEGAPDVAEELVLEQVVRDRRAVDGQEQRAIAVAGPSACSARATSSLPVPDSPVISTLLRVGPTLRIKVLTACIGGLCPTSASRSPCAWSCRRSAWFSSSSRR